MRALARAAVLTAVSLAGILASTGAALAEDNEERFKQIEEQLRQNDKELKSLREKMAANDEKLEAAAEAAGAKPTDLRVYYKTGIRFETADKRYAIQFGGRIMVDFAVYDEDSAVETAIGNFEDGVEVRRARLYASGTIHGTVEYKAQFDFAGGDADIKDMFVGLKGVPVLGVIRVGNLKVPFTLEALTSTKYITFMERSFADDALVPGRRVGVSTFNTVLDSIHWSLMWFNDTDGYAEGTIANNWAGRVAYSWMQDKGKKLIHVGIAGLLLNPRDGRTRLRARPESHLASHRVVDTKTSADLDGDGTDEEYTYFRVENAVELGLELAAVFGPFSAQAEYVLMNANTSNEEMFDDDVLPARDPSFSSWYVYVSYFITGEHRPYKKGSFGRVKPGSNFMDGSGSGAVEIAARYSYVDLQDKEVEGGTANNWTVGVNWYLNSQVRVMTNYILSQVHHVGDIKILQFRFQIDF